MKRYIVFLLCLFCLSLSSFAFADPVPADDALEK